MLTANAMPEHVAAGQRGRRRPPPGQADHAAELIDLALNLPRLAQGSIAA